MNWTALLVGALLIGSGFLYWSCKSSSQIQQQAATLMYEIERTGCLGKCPVYLMEIYSDQKVRIFPRRNLSIESDTFSHLSEAEFDEIRTWLESSSMTDLDSSYDNQVADAPFAILKLHGADETKTIRCRGDAPPAFKQAVDLLEEIAVTRKWLPPKAQRSSDQKQLILDLSSEEFIQDLENKYITYQLKLIKKISPRQSLYLFDVVVATAEMDHLLSTLREDYLIEAAQWNHQLKKR